MHYKNCKSWKEICEKNWGACQNKKAPDSKSVLFHGNFAGYSYFEKKEENTTQKNETARCNICQYWDTNNPDAMYEAPCNHKETLKLVSLIDDGDSKFFITNRDFGCRFCEKREKNYNITIRVKQKKDVPPDDLAIELENVLKKNGFETLNELIVTWEEEGHRLLKA